VFHFDGIASINEAEKFRGLDVLLPFEQRVSLPAGQYFVADLIGCAVFEMQGEAAVVVSSPCAMATAPEFLGTVREEEANASLGSDVSSQPSTSYPALPDKPSIAVLAFTNMSGDPTQDYFSDGITEDIITELSRFAELMVIARNSSFQYKGKSIDVRLVGRELGVRYVLEGSIRRTGDRVRISAQLVDAVTGAHRWAERYDRSSSRTSLRSRTRSPAPSCQCWPST
jgi:TolB-like protein